MVLLLGLWAVRSVVPEERSMFQESKEQGRQQMRTQALGLLCSRYEVNTEVLLRDCSLLIICHNYFIINPLDAETVPSHEYTECLGWWGFNISLGFYALLQCK